MTNSETLITAGTGLATSIVVAQAPINDWVSAVTQLIIAIATLIKLFPKKTPKN